jgi:predicted PhzF superfamily epimerase YddE/YHI9
MTSRGKSLLIQKITARVFCHGPEGGNPLTIFASTVPLSRLLQQDLAKTCSWESVMVSGSNSSTSSSTGSRISDMNFFMPSGEQVSFCAHAAIGGAAAMAFLEHDKFPSWHFRAPMTGETFSVDVKNDSGDCDDDKGTTGSRSSSIWCLHMNTLFREEPLSDSGIHALQRTLKEHLLIPKEHVVASPAGRYCTNASVARPKTLLRMSSVEALHQAMAPPVGNDGNCDVPSFAEICTAMDNSTGLYVYASAKDDESDPYSWECRQFPRASGYAEDPATGIAAAALAFSLELGASGNVSTQTTQQEQQKVYNMYQGTAMGRPSLIQVIDLQRYDDETSSSNRNSAVKVSFGLQGRVEIDSHSTMQVVVDDDKSVVTSEA